jgi:hypothetical protein
MLVHVNAVACAPPPRAHETATAGPAAARLSRGRLLTFFAELAADGKMNRATASLHRTAVRKMLAEFADGEELRRDALDVQALFAGLQRREGRHVKAATLETYRTTFERAVELYRAWGELRREDRPGQVLGRRAARRGAGGGAKGPVFDHVLLLAPARFAELRLPVDLTLTEARRLALFVEALATDHDPGSPALRPSGRPRG